MELPGVQLVSGLTPLPVLRDQPGSGSVSRDWVGRIESPVVMTTCEVHSIASAERVEKLRQADSSRAIGVFSFVGSWRNTRITPMAHLTVDPPKPTTPRDSYDPKEAAIAKLSSISSYQPRRLRSGKC